MDVVERGITSFRGPRKNFNICFTSLFNNLSRKTRLKKIGLLGESLEEEKANIVDWIFGM
jgi:hypothetical protein